MDYSLFKNFPIKERLKLQFRAELFNALNHPNFNNPAATFGNANFGFITSTSTENRDIQFGLKLAFWIPEGGRASVLVPTSLREKACRFTEGRLNACPTRPAQ